VENATAARTAPSGSAQVPVRRDGAPPAAHLGRPPVVTIGVTTAPPPTGTLPVRGVDGRRVYDQPTYSEGVSGADTPNPTRRVNPETNDAGGVAPNRRAAHCRPKAADRGTVPRHRAGRNTASLPLPRLPRHRLPRLVLSRAPQ
jgi:hypothetical protein